MMNYQELPPDPNAPNVPPPGLIEALSRLLTKPGMIAPPQNWPPAPAMGQPPVVPPSAPAPSPDDSDVDYQKMRY